MTPSNIWHAHKGVYVTLYKWNEESQEWIVIGSEYVLLLMVACIIISLASRLHGITLTLMILTLRNV